MSGVMLLRHSLRKAFTPFNGFSVRHLSISPGLSPEELERKYVVGTYNSTGVRTTEHMEFSHGEGVYLYDTNGKRYLDFGSGIAVNVLGHGHKQWSAAVADQAKRLCHVSNLYHTRPYLSLAQRLVENSSFDKAFFCNSGTEANEGALKFSRLWARKQAEQAARSNFNCPNGCSTGAGTCACWGEQVTPHKTKFIAFQGGFHGRTMGSLSLTHKPAIREPFAPLLPDVSFVPFNDLDATAAALQQQVGAVCAVFVEPIQGEGGVIPAQLSFLQGVRRLCDEHNALMVVDEVQAGLGRTGRLWAHEAYDIKPDIMTLAKPLANGLPIGAVLVTDAVASAVRAGDHGTTFGGNVVACRGAEVVMDQLLAPGFLEDVQAMGRHLVNGLEELKTQLPEYIASVRSPIGGSAPFAAIDLTAATPAGAAGKVMVAAAQRGMLVLTAGDRTLRVAPPLIAQSEHCDEFLSVLRDAIVDVGLEATENK